MTTQTSTICWNCWTNKHPVSTKCPMPQLTFNQKERLRIQRGVPFPNGKAGDLYRQAVQKIVCFNCWRHGHIDLSCPDERRSISARERIRVANGQPMHDVWSRRLKAQEPALLQGRYEVVDSEDDEEVMPSNSSNPTGTPVDEDVTQAADVIDMTMSPILLYRANVSENMPNPTDINVHPNKASSSNASSNHSTSKSNDSIKSLDSQNDHQLIETRPLPQTFLETNDCDYLHRIISDQHSTILRMRETMLRQGETIQSQNQTIQSQGRLIDNLTQELLLETRAISHRRTLSGE